MAHMPKPRQLHGFFVDGRGHDGVNQAKFEVIHGSFEALLRISATNVGGLAERDVDVIVPNVYDIDFIILQPVGVALADEGDFVKLHNVFVVGNDLGGAVNNWHAQVEYAAMRKCFQDNLQPDAVDVAGGDAENGLGAFGLWALVLVVGSFHLFGVFFFQCLIGLNAGWRIFEKYATGDLLSGQGLRMRIWLLTH